MAYGEWGHMGSGEGRGGEGQEGPATNMADITFRNQNIRYPDSSSKSQLPFISVHLISTCSQRESRGFFPRNVHGSKTTASSDKRSIIFSIQLQPPYFLRVDSCSLSHPQSNRCRVQPNYYVKHSSISENDKQPQVYNSNRWT